MNAYEQNYIAGFAQGVRDVSTKIAEDVAQWANVDIKTAQDAVEELLRHLVSETKTANAAYHAYHIANPYIQQEQQMYAPPNRFAGTPPPSSVAANIAGAGAGMSLAGVGAYKLKQLAAKNAIGARVGAENIGNAISSHAYADPSKSVMHNLQATGAPKDVMKYHMARRNMIRMGGLGLGLYGLSQIL